MVTVARSNAFQVTAVLCNEKDSLLVRKLGCFGKYGAVSDASV